MDLNKVQIIGNITNDIEVKQASNGNKVANFNVATNRRWKDSAGNEQEKAEFHNVTFWGNLAEIAEKYLTKGKKVYVEGRLETQSWEGQDGTKRYKTVIVGENLIMLSKNDSGTVNNSTTPKSETKPTQKAEEDVSVEDLPF